MSKDHPFQTLFETLSRVPLAHAPEVNRQAHQQLAAILSVPLDDDGACTLLRAPRAGYGKTHMLSRIRHQFDGSHECIQLRALRGYQIDAATVLGDVMRHLSGRVADAAGETHWDHLARYLFAMALMSLVESGEVPSQDPEGAMASLLEQPLETLDFHDPKAMTAHWMRENFPVLAERLAVVLSDDCGQPVSEVATWVDAMFRYVTTAPDDPGRHRLLEFSRAVEAAAGMEEMARLEALLGLLGLIKRVVLIADDLEGFSTDQGAALSFATFIVALRQSVPRLEVLLSLNCDVWDSVFVPCLSDGLADRLAERVVELEPLTEREMVALLESRAPGHGARVLAHIDRSKSGTHARGLIKQAATAWLAAGNAEPDDSVSGAPVVSSGSRGPTPLMPAMPKQALAPDPQVNPEPAGGDLAQGSPVADPLVSAETLGGASEESPAAAAEPDAMLYSDLDPVDCFVSPVAEATMSHPPRSAEESYGEAQMLEPAGLATPPPVPDDRGQPRLDPEEEARVEELLRQFRERFGQR